ncbi:MAG: hypothetical protein ACI9OJ_003018, partial [Myxococcota bacterium]
LCVVGWVAFRPPLPGEPGEPLDAWLLSDGRVVAIHALDYPPTRWLQSLVASPRPTVTAVAYGRDGPHSTEPIDLLTAQRFATDHACGGWRPDEADPAAFELALVHHPTGARVRLPRPADAPFVACVELDGELAVAFSSATDGFVVGVATIPLARWRWVRRLTADPTSGVGLRFAAGNLLVADRAAHQLTALSAVDGGALWQRALTPGARIVSGWLVDGCQVASLHDGTLGKSLGWSAGCSPPRPDGLIISNAGIQRLDVDSVTSVVGALVAPLPLRDGLWPLQALPSQVQEVIGDYLLSDPWQNVRFRAPQRSGWVVFGRDRTQRRGHLELLQATDWRRTVRVVADYAGMTALQTVIRRRWGVGGPTECHEERFAGHRVVRCSGPTPTSTHRDVTAIRRGSQVLRIVVDVDEPDAPVEGVRELVDVGLLGRAARLPAPLADATGPDWRVRDGRFVSDAYGLQAIAGGAWTVQVDPWLPEGVHGVVALGARDPDVSLVIRPTAEFADPLMGPAQVFEAGSGVATLRRTESVEKGLVRWVGTLTRGDQVLGIDATVWSAESERGFDRLQDGLKRLSLAPAIGVGGATTLTPSVGPSHRLDGRGFRDHGLSIGWTRPDGTLWRVRRIAIPQSSEVLRFSHAALAMTATLHASHVATEDGEGLHDSTVATLLGDLAPDDETRGVVFGGLSAWETEASDGSGTSHIITALASGVAYSLLVRVPAGATNGEASRNALGQLMPGFRLGQTMDRFQITRAEVRDPLLGYAFALPDGWLPGSCARNPGVGVECRDGRSEISVTVTVLGDPFVNLDDAFETMEAGFRRFLEARNLATLGTGRATISGQRARHLRWKPGDGLEAHEYRLARHRTMYGISIVTDRPELVDRWRRGFRLLE